jgi:hypothetical protein
MVIWTPPPVEGPGYTVGFNNKLDPCKCGKKPARTELVRQIAIEILQQINQIKFPKHLPL